MVSTFMYLEAQTSCFHLLSSDPASSLPPPDAWGLLAPPALSLLEALLATPWHSSFLDSDAAVSSLGAHGQEGIPFLCPCDRSLGPPGWAASSACVMLLTDTLSCSWGTLDFAMPDSRRQLLEGLIMKPKCR